MAGWRMVRGLYVNRTCRLPRRSVSLRALFSASLPRCYVMLSSFRAHVHSAARIGQPCPPYDRGSVVRLCRKAATTKKCKLVAKMHPLESKCSHVTAPARQWRFSQEEANALSSWWANADDARRVNLPSSSLSVLRFRARDFTFSHQTAADTHRKVEGGLWKRARDKGDCCPLDSTPLASCWKSEDRHGCSGHVLASNIISHMQYTYEVTVVLTSRRGPCKSGFHQR